MSGAPMEPDDQRWLAMTQINATAAPIPATLLYGPHLFDTQTSLCLRCGVTMENAQAGQAPECRVPPPPAVEDYATIRRRLEELAKENGG